MKKNESAAIDFPLWQLFYRSFWAANKVREKELGPYDITPRQSAVLRLIVRLGDRATPGEISRQLFVEAHTMSEQINRLEKDGLVMRVKDLSRKNLVRIALTKKGQGLYRKSLNQKSIEVIFSGLTEQEKLQFWAVLAKIREKAVKKLGIKNLDLYPPSDPADLHE